MAETDKTSRPPVVLVANDEEWSARSLESILGPNGYAVLRALSGRQAIDLARDTQPDAIFLDLHLPDMDGAEMCRLLRGHPRIGAATPIVVTTAGASSRADIVRSYASGATEFYAQPFDSEMLLLKLANSVRAKTEVDRLAGESLTDRASGLYSFRGLAQRAREIGSDAHRHRTALACVAFSADADLSDIEAQMLDDITQRVVQHLGVVCRSCGRASDAVGRLSPSDFGLIAPDTDRSGALRLVERLRKSLQDSPLPIEGRSRAFDLRVGYAVVPNFAESPVDALELLLRAAAALRHARTRKSGPILAFDDVPVSELQ